MGKTLAAKQEVVSQWGASINGYWGSNSNSTIDQEVLNGIQLQPAAVGSDITMSTGNKNAEATALDTRVNQDNNLTDNNPTAYQDSSTHNRRRLIALPILTPVVVGGSADGYVLGYGSFLLETNGSPSNYYAAGNGNDPFCAIYAGPYCQGCTGTGGENTVATESNWSNETEAFSFHQPTRHRRGKVTLNSRSSRGGCWCP